RALVHQNRGTVREWTIDHVAVACDPADVRSAPVKIVVFDIEDPLGREVCLQQVTGGRMQDSFWLTSRAGGVENVEWMFAVELCRRPVSIDSLHQLIPPEISTWFHVLRCPGAFDHDAGIH